MSTPLRTLLMTTTALLALGAGHAAAGPDGGSVVGGSATIQGQGTSSVTINQSSNSAIINWKSFNIGTGETTTFHQPSSSSVILNRVTGGLGPSWIDGVLNANGRVFIVNRDGILFGKNATINTASFLATTNDIADSDFMAGRMNFNIPGRPDASIVNQGSITAMTGGFAALVAPGVRNSGTITATLGTVALASGNMFTLDMYGDRLIQLGVNDAVASQVIDVQTGKPLKTLISNEGALKANGGRVQLTAVAARAVVDSVINNKGVIEANSIGMHNGKIVLGAATGGHSTHRQKVKVSGKISARGKDQGSKGGSIVVTGEDIEVANAEINASGSSGGGTVLIGGDWAGGHPNDALINNVSAKLESYLVPTATTVTFDRTSLINASATDSGHGGKVILWSESRTTFAGAILARGGANGGDGGFVETSGHQLALTGTVDTRAPHGKTGTLLLDPSDVVISNKFNDGSESTILVSDLVNQLSKNDVVVTTSNSNTESNQLGNITVDAGVAWTTDSTLTLHADHSIFINAAITALNGGLTLQANNEINTSATGSINVGTFTLDYGNWIQNSSTLPAFAARDFRINDGSFLRVTGGNGDNEPYQVADAYGLQGIGSSGMADRNYVLIGDIDASATANWNQGQGFVPIGSNYYGFDGSFDGQGHTIKGLTIAPRTDSQFSDIGLFSANFGTISNLNLADVSITGNPNSWQGQTIGGLAGRNAGTIDHVTVSGMINGMPPGQGGSPLSLSGVIAGGLVGQNGAFGEGGPIGGTITNSAANVTVKVGDGCTNYCEGGGPNIAGGLVGLNIGGTNPEFGISSITGSHATGSVTGGENTIVGGLVGQNGDAFWSDEVYPATIVSSWANVAVSAKGSSTIGGLVGLNQTGSTITDSQAFGAVTASAGTEEEFGFAFANAGGLVGENHGTITSTTAPSLSSTCVAGAAFSCAAGMVTADSDGASIGGLVGWNSEDGDISNSLATGAVTMAGTNAVDQTIGGFVGDNEGQISNAFATGEVSSSGDGAFIGGFAGTNSQGGVITGSSATGNVNVTGATFAFVGGFVGGNAGSIHGSTNNPSSASGNVNLDAAFGVGGGYAGINAGTIALADASGNVTGGDGAWLGGFVGWNGGSIDQAYARGATTGGAGSFVGGFVAVNFTFIDGEVEATEQNITHAYALGPATGGPASYVAAFAALNFGSLDQVYGVGLVTGGAGSTTGGLVASNNLTSLTVPGPPDGNNVSVNATASSFNDTTSALSAGTTTHSYWDTQATGQQTSAGGTGVDTATLAGAVPADFDPAIWAHGSYPHLVNLGQQDTTPRIPLPPDNPPPTNNPPDNTPPDNTLPDNTPTDTSSQFVQQLTNDLTLNTQPSTDPIVTAPPPSNTGSGSQGQQLTTGSINPPMPGRLDVGPGRYFYLPLDETRIVKDEVVLQLPCNVSQQTLEAVARETQLSVLGSQCLGTSGMAVYRMHIGGGKTISDVIRALAKHQIIVAAQANYTYALTQKAPPAEPKPAAEPQPSAQPEAATAPQAPTLASRTQEGDASQYVLGKLRLSQIHRQVTGSNITVAVIDSEIDVRHPDLKGNIFEEYDATGKADKPHAHGTGMAGAIVAHHRLMGVAPGARIVAIHAFSSGASAESTTFNILKGLDWAVEHKVRIVNMSFAGPRDPSLERALKAAHDKGIVLIAAAGNAGPKSPPLYPAADVNVIAVTATDIDDKLFSGANRGRYIGVAAPGVDIVVPAPDNTYQMTTGTSVATAHVSGIVALLLERNPRLKPEDVRRILAASAKRLGPHNEFGAGLVDPIKALQLAAPREASVP